MKVHIIKINKCVSKTHISPYAQLIPGGVVHGPLKGTKQCATSVSTQVIFGVDLLTFRPDIAYKRRNCEKKTKLYQLCSSNRIWTSDSNSNRIWKLRMSRSKSYIRCL